MSNDMDVITTNPAAILALFAALVASACEDPEDPEAFAAALADDDDAADRAAPSGLLAAPVPKGFYIEQVKTGGSGCPDPGSVHVTLSADKTTLRLLYDKLQLKREPGAAVQTASCTAALILRVPAGWRVAPANLVTRGYAYLDKGVKARRNTELFFAGVPGGPDFNTDFKGPFNNIYQAADLVLPAAATWSGCGGSAVLSISNGLALNAVANPDAAALFTLHDQRLVSWQFKQC